MRQCKDSSVFSTFWLALVSHSKAKGTSTKEVYVNFPIISFEVLVANPLPYNYGFRKGIDIQAL